MSDTTLYSSLYRRIDDYAELVDRVLVELLSDVNTTQSTAQKRLGELLKGLANAAESKLSVQMVAEMLRENEEVNEQELLEAADALLQGSTDETTRNILERFANLLDQERTKVMARIRGERR